MEFQQKLSPLFKVSTTPSVAELDIAKIASPYYLEEDKDPLDLCQQESTENIIVQKRWRWIGHVLRKDQNAIPRVAVQWKPEGHRKRGRPKITWRRTVETEAATMGQSWGTLRTLGQDLRLYIEQIHKRHTMTSQNPCTTRISSAILFGL
ncbi:hypothetical protein ElyMa_000052000 [Elysia marginata]|uniref:Uncharacterized protein n=1 Tax=Elysia marginata TaxID=1093978 RepID=A0AAV4EF32_9GAST|nr:hypothetical protein ElyMa_000052000 [Elysia marginata]